MGAVALQGGIGKTNEAQIKCSAGFCTMDMLVKGMEGKKLLERPK